MNMTNKKALALGVRLAVGVLAIAMAIVGCKPEAQGAVDSADKALATKACDDPLLLEWCNGPRRDVPIADRAITCIGTGPRCIAKPGSCLALTLGAAGTTQITAAEARIACPKLTDPAAPNKCEMVAAPFPASSADRSTPVCVETPKSKFPPVRRPISSTEDCATVGGQTDFTPTPPDAAYQDYCAKTVVTRPSASGKATKCIASGTSGEMVCGADPASVVRAPARAPKTITSTDYCDSVGNKSSLTPIPTDDEYRAYCAGTIVSPPPAVGQLAKCKVFSDPLSPERFCTADPDSVVSAPRLPFPDAVKDISANALCHTVGDQNTFDPPQPDTKFGGTRAVPISFDNAYNAYCAGTTLTTSGAKANCTVDATGGKGKGKCVAPAGTMALDEAKYCSELRADQCPDADKPVAITTAAATERICVQSKTVAPFCVPWLVEAGSCTRVNGDGGFLLAVATAGGDTATAMCEGATIDGRAQTPAATVCKISDVAVNPDDIVLCVPKDADNAASAFGASNSAQSAGSKLARLGCDLLNIAACDAATTGDVGALAYNRYLDEYTASSRAINLGHGGYYLVCANPGKGATKCVALAGEDAGKRCKHDNNGPWGYPGMKAQIANICSRVAEAGNTAITATADIDAKLQAGTACDAADDLKSGGEALCAKTDDTKTCKGNPAPSQALGDALCQGRTQLVVKWNDKAKGPFDVSGAPSIVMGHPRTGTAGNACEFGPLKWTSTSFTQGQWLFPNGADAPTQLSITSTVPTDPNAGKNGCAIAAP